MHASDFLPLLMPWLRAMTEALPEMARQIDDRNYVVDGGSNLAMQAVALDGIVEAARTGGVGTELAAPMRALVWRRVADGFGADDLSGLIELLRP